MTASCALGQRFRRSAELPPGRLRASSTGFEWQDRDEFASRVRNSIETHGPLHVIDPVTPPALPGGDVSTATDRVFRRR